jgi:hypothetical protein
MRRFVVCTAAAAALLLGVFSAAPAYASHESFLANVQIRHKGEIVRQYVAQPQCSATTCAVEFNLDRRDFRRFMRWTGDTAVTHTVLSGQTTSVLVFPGPSTWSLRTSVLLLDSNVVPTTHVGDVVVVIRAAT